jgi:hypothetical protein
MTTNGELYVNRVLARCESLSQAQFWTRDEPLLQPRAWLNNFEEDERPTAAALIETFSFFNELQTTRLFQRSLRQMLSARSQASGDPETRRTDCSSFLGEAVFTPVEGESPNPSDSGNFLCRRVRQILEHPDDSQIMTPDAAVEAAKQGKPVVFVDDFVGSGNQMKDTWRRVHAGTAAGSFENLAASRSIDVSYVSLVATKTGLTNLTTVAPQLHVFSAHAVDGRDRFTESLQRIADPPVPTEDLLTSADDLLRKYAPMLVLPPYLVGDARAYGFHNLGLSIAFNHSVPDATLPIFWAPGTGDWTPLRRRA